jgi:hypothetical protein
MHTLALSYRKTSRKYGVIQCDSLVLKGLEQTVSNLVIFRSFNEIQFSYFIVLYNIEVAWGMPSISKQIGSF